MLHVPGAVFKQERASITPRPNGALSLLFFSLQLAAMRRFLKRSSPGLVPGDLLRKFPPSDCAPNLAPDHRAEASPEGFRVVTLNVQHTVKGKEAGLRGLITQLHFPDVLFLHEVGKLHPDHSLHPLYQSWIIPGHRAQMGLAVMLKKDPTLVVHAQDFMFNCRSQVLCLTYHGTKYLLATVYLHADGNVTCNQKVLDW